MIVGRVSPVTGGGVEVLGWATWMVGTGVLVGVDIGVAEPEATYWGIEEVAESTVNLRLTVVQSSEVGS